MFNIRAGPSLVVCLSVKVASQGRLTIGQRNSCRYSQKFHAAMRRFQFTTEVARIKSPRLQDLCNALQEFNCIASSTYSPLEVEEPSHRG